MRILNFNKAILLVLISGSVLAEYRVYQYMISPRLQTRKPSSFMVTSTLDPQSYVSYHGGAQSLRVNLLKTWTCKGHTGKKEVCKDPIVGLLETKTGNE